MEKRVIFCFMFSVTLICQIDSAPKARPPDCDDKLIEMDGCVKRMLVFNDPSITRYSSKQDFDDKYCK